MRTPSLGAILSISVDLNEPHVSEGCSPDTFRRTAERLVELFAAARLSVTWASTNPAASDAIASRDAGQRASRSGADRSIATGSPAKRGRTG